MFNRMGRPTRAAALCVCILAVTAWATAAQPPKTARTDSRPKLFVLLVVDQMRGDYLERYGDQWTRGLRRLVDHGANFRRGAFPYATLVTCVGHATISTGAYPSTHGIVGNSWFDKSTWKSVACSDVAEHPLVSYGRPVKGGNGPDRLLVPAFADELRGQSPAPTRVVSMSIKARTAIMMAGRRAETVLWYSSEARGFVTSSFYSPQPVPWVTRFVKANPIDAEFATPWTKGLPDPRYKFEDDGLGEKPPAYWKTTFPHPFSGLGAEQDSWRAWEGSPRSDAYLGRLAAEAVDALQLGRGQGTDFLAISFSALDIVGHGFGPESHEVQDILIRIDETIGTLLTHLDKTVGVGNYTVALTADHGVALIPEAAKADGLDAGRLKTSLVLEAAQNALQRTLGMADYKTRLSGADVYVEASVTDKLRAHPLAAAEIARAIAAVPGVAKAFVADDLPRLAAAGDRDAKAAWLSYRPGRSGDFVVLPKPHWFFVGESGGDGSSHSLPYLYDSAVPVVLYGAGIKPGEYLEPASPADIMPTFAILAGITMSRPDGTVLSSALAPRRR